MDGGKDTVGWYPLFGVTHYPEELDTINKIRGKTRGSCGDNGSGGGLIDNIFNTADPYLSAATTYINGAYELFVGTPVEKELKRKTRTELLIPQLRLIIKNTQSGNGCKKRKQNADLNEEQLEAQYQEYIKRNTTNNNDDAVLVADHSSYTSNYTRDSW